MKSRTTLLLAILAALSAMICVAAWLWFSDQRDTAQSARDNLDSARRDLSMISTGRRGGGKVASASLDTAAVTAKLRQAATAAGLTDVPDITPDPPQKLGDSDYSQTFITIGLRTISIQQAMIFLHALSTNDPSCRVKQIELSPPPDARQAELWMIDVELAYLTYTPRRRENP